MAPAAHGLRDLAMASAGQHFVIDDAETPLVEDGLPAGSGIDSPHRQQRPLAAGRWRRATLRACASLAFVGGVALLCAASHRSRAAPGMMQSRLEGHQEEKVMGWHMMGDNFGWSDFAPAADPSKLEECGQWEEGYDYNASRVIQTLVDVGTATMCCSACAAYPECGTWTWGAVDDAQWVTHVCWLKALAPGQLRAVAKVAKPGVYSGYPAPGVGARKAGVVAPPPSQSLLLDGVHPKNSDGSRAAPAEVASQGTTFGKCPGNVFVKGHGSVSLINAGANVPGQPSGKVQALEGDLIVPFMDGRTYFGNSCQEGDYSPESYQAMNLLGKKLSWTTDVSGTACGCNAALYLVNMPQNNVVGTCHDYYCDAMSVCGVPCAEIDLQEANQYSWMSTLHAYNPDAGADGLGVGIGYGGSRGEPERRDWTALEYGPGAGCIDTTRPFQVSVSFPTDMQGTLTGMQVELSQEGSSCGVGGTVSEYSVQGHEALKELTQSLQAGMTPVISYWKSTDMLWMDGIGADGRGPCVQDTPDQCPEHVRFYGFSVDPL